jgi:hypothetical protein
MTDTLLSPSDTSGRLPLVEPARLADVIRAVRKA